MKILRPYQVQGVQYCLDVVNPAIFYDMRLGKTTVILHATIKWDCKKILINAPYATLKGWRDDVKEDTHTKLIELTMRTADRLEYLEKMFAIKSANYFFASKECHLYLPELKDFPWDCVIIDESTFIKSAETTNESTRFGKRDNVSKYFCNNFRDVSHRAILCGLPNPEGDLDYFQQLKFLDHKYVAPYKNFHAYRSSCCIELIRKRTFFLCAKPKKKLVNLLAEKCSFLKRMDIGFKDPKIYQVRLIERDREFNRVLKRLLDTMELINKDGEIVDMTTWGMVKYIWYHELCGGFVNKELLFNHKIIEIKKLFGSRGELKGEKAIIWANYLPEIKALNAHIKRSTVIHGKVAQKKREQRIEQFKRKGYQFLICQPICINVGTDLSCCDTMVYYSTPTSYNIRAQSEDRFINVTQKQAKLIIDLHVDDSIDVDIYNSLKRKEHVANMTNRMAKRLQKEVENFYIKKGVHL